MGRIGVDGDAVEAEILGQGRKGGMLGGGLVALQGDEYGTRHGAALPSGTTKSEASSVHSGWSMVAAGAGMARGIW